MNGKNLSQYVAVLMVGIFFFSNLALAQEEQKMEISKQLDAVQRGKADIVFTNGRICTVNKKSPFAEAVAVKDGIFMEVGFTKDIKNFLGKQTRVVDLGGAFAMPGFIV